MSFRRVPANQFWRWGSIICILAVLVGCKKLSTTSVPIDSSMIIISGPDINSKGGLSSSGLKKLDAEAGKPAITVLISRAHITDEALTQLAKYKNIVALQAPGSQLSDAAIEQLKSSSPALKDIIK